MIRKLFLCLACLLTLQQLLARSNDIRIAKSQSVSGPEAMVLPPSNFIKLFSLDQEQTVADLLWVKCILYFADEFVGGRNYKHLSRLLDTVTDLDPRFEQAYIWGGAVFIYNGLFISRHSVDMSNEIMLKGWRYYKESPIKWKTSHDFWRIPFMIGFNYAIELREREKAIPYLVEAAKFPEVPGYMKLMSSSIMSRLEKYDMAIDTLEEQLTLESLRINLKQVQDEQQRDALLARIRNIYNSTAARGGSIQEMWERRARLNQLYRAYLTDFKYLPLPFYQLIYSATDATLPSAYFPNISLADAP